MTHKAVLGLDAAQAGARYHLTDPTGRLLAHGDAAMSQEGWQQLLAAVEANGLSPCDCLAGIEATGVHHLPWCEALHHAGATTLVLNPLVAKRTTPVSNAIRDHKSDPIDAEGIALTVRREAEQLTRFTYRSEPARFGLHKLQAVHRAVRHALTNIKKHCGSLLDLVFPELSALSLTPLRRNRLLRVAPTPAQIAALPTQELHKLVGDKADAVLAGAKRSFAPAALVDACAPAVQSLLEVIEQLERQLRHLENQITAQAQQALPATWLNLALSLPAFGPKTAPIVLAHTPPELIELPRSRKRKVACLQALFGMDPRVRTSGKWKGKIKLSKRGIRAARTAMYQIAMCSLQHDVEALTYYRRLRDIGKKPHKVALYDLARKHLRRLVAVLDSGQPYQPRASLAPT